MKPQILITLKVAESIALPSLCHDDLVPIINAYILKFLKSNEVQVIDYFESEETIDSYWEKITAYNRVPGVATFITVPKLFEEHYAFEGFQQYNDEILQHVIGQFEEDRVQLDLTLTRLRQNLQEIHLSFKAKK